MIWFGYKDVIDRLNFVWTSLILLIFALSIGFLRYFFLQSLITCWTPDQFNAISNAYVHQTCWEKDTASIPAWNIMPIPKIKDLNGSSVWHAWIPILAVFLFIGFKIPEAIKILLDLCAASTTRSLVAVTDSWKERSKCLAECGRDIVQKTGVMKTLSYFLVKIVILVNLIAQFSFIQIFLRDKVNSEVMNNATMNVLPKVIICEFDIRQLQNIRTFVVQCEMPVNTLYQVFLRLFGYWVLGVGLLTGAMFLFQLGTLIIPPLVCIRFRGIIPEKQLKLRGFCVDDALLFLEDVRDECGIGMARSVASKMWEDQNMTRNEASAPMPHTVGGDNFNQVSRNDFHSDSAGVYPLLETSFVTDNTEKA